MRLPRALSLGVCHPVALLQLSELRELGPDLVVLPSFTFDRVWIAQDTRVSITDYCNSFDDFFMAERPVSLASFFPAAYAHAYAYHWHNRWRVPFTPGTIVAKLWNQVQRRFAASVPAAPMGASNAGANGIDVQAPRAEGAGVPVWPNCMSLGECHRALATVDRDAPPAGTVHVWYARTESLSAGELTSLEEILSSDERARRKRFAHDRDRRDYTAAHALVRRALSHYADVAPGQWRFETGRFGRPAISTKQAGDPPLNFNLSHTHGLVACAIGRGTRLGIDIERCDRVTEGVGIAARLFTPAEVWLLANTPRDEVEMRFVELWTLKESYIKAIGVGLSLPLNSFGFSFEGTSGLTFTCPASSSASWQFWLAELSATTRVAVAASCERPPASRTIVYYDTSGDGEAEAATARASILRHTQG
jgi:4'-phosphopantetheinyl transferase